MGIRANQEANLNSQRKLTSATLEVPDELEALYDEVYSRGWTDGLPIVLVQAWEKNLGECTGRSSCQYSCCFPKLNVC